MTTGGSVERNALTILWHIENVRYFQRGLHGKEIRSPNFYPRNLKEKWSRLYLYPGGEGVGDGNGYLRFNSGSCVPVDVEFSIFAWDGSCILIRRGIEKLDSGIVVPDMMAFLTEEELLAVKKPSFLLKDTLTVRCRVWKSKGNFSNAEFYSVSIRIDFREESISWPIKGFGQILNQNETIPIKIEFTLGRVELDLTCSLTGYSSQNHELNSVILANEIPQSCIVKLAVSLSDNRQRLKQLVGEECTFFPSGAQRPWKVSKLVLRNTLKEKMSLLRCGESLNFIFHFTFVSNIFECIERKFYGTYWNECITFIERKLDGDGERTTSSESSCQTSELLGGTPAPLRNASALSETGCQTSELLGGTPAHLQRGKNYLDTLGEDLFSLYQNQTFSDFELRAGDVSFPVHKVVLGARSPVFRTILSGEEKDSNSQSLDIRDLDGDTLGRLLTFLYAGTVQPDLTLGNAAKLYYAADQYGVDTLKGVCSSFLQSQVSVQNVSEILTLADQYQDSGLTLFVHNFIMSHFDDVMHSDEWENFLNTNPILAGRSMHLIYKKKAPKRQRLQ